MVLVRILGLIDLISAFIFLIILFGGHPYFQIVLFCAGILLIKGLFVLKGDLLSLVDLFSSFMLLLSLIFALPLLLLWISAFLLIAKGIVSFF